MNIVLNVSYNHNHEMDWQAAYIALWPHDRDQIDDLIEDLAEQGIYPTADMLLGWSVRRYPYILLYANTCN